MNHFQALAVGAGSLLATGVASAQDGHMMDGDMWGSGWMGGYGGTPMILLVVIVVGLIVWLVKRGD